MSALPPKADISRACWDVRFVPKADIGSYSISWGLQLAKTAATMPLPVNYRGLEAEYCLQMLPAKNPRNSAGRPAKRGHWTQGALGFSTTSLSPRLTATSSLSRGGGQIDLVGTVVGKTCCKESKR